MLRETKSSQLKSKLYYFETTSASGPVITSGTGTSDLSSTTITGGFTASINLREDFRQNAVYVVSQGTTNGGFNDSGGTAAGACAAKRRTNTGTAAVGVQNWLVYGTDSPTIDNLPPSNMRTGIDRTRLIWGKISSAGAVSIGKSDFSVTRTATGVYSVTYKRAFGETACAFANPIGNNFRGVNITSRTASGCLVTISDDAPDNQDSDFYICAIGTDAIQETGRGRHLVMNSQRKPRIEALAGTVSGGTVTQTFGTKIGSITDNGTGDFSFTLNTPYKREFAFFSMCGPAGATALQGKAKAAATTSVANIGCYTNTGTLTDPTSGSDLMIICIGSDDAGEY